MTHNVFGLNYDMQRVNKVIAAEDPDIVVLQEYFVEQSTDLHPLLSARYPHFVRCRGGKRANLGLYSKLPFDHAGDCPEDAAGSQRTATILATFTLADGSGFSLITTHVDWPFPVERQQAQLAALAEAAKAVEVPLIVVADFNSTPWSYALKGFAAEAGMERQDHNLVTYPLRFTVPYRIDRRGLIDTIPFLPLDHVFTRDGVLVHELHRGAETGSDHLPIVFSFSVPPSR
jgi:endonuclease/exonuclease/phosphatase (EEP) superfamily protein YafD